MIEPISARIVPGDRPDVRIRAVDGTATAAQWDRADVLEAITRSKGTAQVAGREVFVPLADGSTLIVALRT